jgi:hypothetical protein
VELVGGRSLLASYFSLVSCLAYFWTLMMEAICSSETSVDFQRTKRHYIPRDHLYENFKPYIMLLNSRRISVKVDVLKLSTCMKLGS